MKTKPEEEHQINEVNTRIFLDLDPTKKMVRLRLESENGKSEVGFKLETLEVFAKGIKKAIKKLKLLG